jgi:hypothetical protein
MTLPRYIHLYDRDNNWLGQFHNVEDIENHVNELGKDINEFKLVFASSAYPTNTDHPEVV